MTPLRVAFAAAMPLAFPPSWVAESVLDGVGERLFARAYTEGLDLIPPASRRGHLPAVTGAVAEAVAARVLVGAGFELVAQLTTPGARGVDLLLLTPAGNVIAVEVKGTLRGSLPRLRRGRAAQLSAAWLDGVNAAMEEWGLVAADIYSAVVFVDLAAAVARVVASSDHSAYVPVDDLAAIDVTLASLP